MKIPEGTTKTRKAKSNSPSFHCFFSFFFSLSQPLFSFFLGVAMRNSDSNDNNNNNNNNDNNNNNNNRYALHALCKCQYNNAISTATKYLVANIELLAARRDAMASPSL